MDSMKCIYDESSTVLLRKPSLSWEPAPFVAHAPLWFSLGKLCHIKNYTCKWARIVKRGTYKAHVMKDLEQLLLLYFYLMCLCSFVYGTFILSVLYRSLFIGRESQGIRMRLHVNVQLTTSMPADIHWPLDNLPPFSRHRNSPQHPYA